jgi:hypothetical protein
MAAAAPPPATVFLLRVEVRQVFTRQCLVLPFPTAQNPRHSKAPSSRQFPHVSAVAVGSVEKNCFRGEDVQVGQNTQNKGVNSAEQAKMGIRNRYRGDMEMKNNQKNTKKKKKYKTYRRNRALQNSSAQRSKGKKKRERREVGR